eukprot:611297-Rhodomonas_salina.1
MTWKSKPGQQQAVLDHIWYCQWRPQLLREVQVGVGVEWREDFHYDHAIRWAEFHGNYVGFGMLRDTTCAPFLPKLELSSWKDQKEEVHERGNLLKPIDPFLDSLEQLPLEEAPWRSRSFFGASLDNLFVTLDQMLRRVWERQKSPLVWHL